MGSLQAAKKICLTGNSMLKTFPSVRRSVPWFSLFCAIWCAFYSLPAFAVVQLDATSTPATVGVQGSTSLSWNHVLGSGSNRMIVCGVKFGYNDTALASPRQSLRR